jgi:adenylate cyclase class 1
MIQRILARNKNIYIKYNRFRKQIFSELAPKESETVLYLLPWLLSINHPACPGYMADLERPFRVFNIDNENAIRKREPVFKRIFGIKRKGSFLPPPSKYYLIQGLYTIGSIGTVSQTSLSDCDIWVCFDKKKFNKTAWLQLNQKINLIKDWMDMYLKMPVFFFISDIAAVKKSRFGSVDSESSGSTQKNVLKEEFYRTCILICGKIPLWWLCYDENSQIDYKKALSAIKKKEYKDNDLINFGNLEYIENSEYFGAALWQLHKSLTHPLKSIIKMVLLKMLLDAPREGLLCHQFRKQVLSTKNHSLFPDYNIFTMSSILNYYKDKSKKALNFLLECFYLRCEIKPYDKTQKLKNKLVDDFFNQYQIDRNTRIRLSNFVSWRYDSQIELGNRISGLLFQIYNEIAAANSGVVSESNEKDLTILGRKVSACYLKKEYKIPVIQKPTHTLNLSDLTLSLNGEVWDIFSANEKSDPVASSKDIIYNIAFLVWNNLFAANKIYMEPNPSGIALQEIINLGIRMKDFFGTYDALDIELSHYLQKEHITKLLVIVSFENSPWEKNINDFGIVYNSSWGELFVRRFNSIPKLKVFLKNASIDRWNIGTSYYVQKNSASYEKIIERTKKIILPSIKS